MHLRHRRPTGERYATADTEWQNIKITVDSGSTVDVMPSDEFYQVEAVPFKGNRTNITMLAANGTKIEPKGEKKFKAMTDERFSLDCKFISDAVKKILKSMATTCDEVGEKG